MLVPCCIRSIVRFRVYISNCAAVLRLSAQNWLNLFFPMYIRTKCSAQFSESCCVMCFAIIDENTHWYARVRYIMLIRYRHSSCLIKFQITTTRSMNSRSNNSRSKHCMSKTSLSAAWNSLYKITPYFITVRATGFHIYIFHNNTFL